MALMRPLLEGSPKPLQWGFSSLCQLFGTSSHLLWVLWHICNTFYWCWSLAPTLRMYKIGP